MCRHKHLSLHSSSVIYFLSALIDFKPLCDSYEQNGETTGVSILGSSEGYMCNICKNLLHFMLGHYSLKRNYLIDEILKLQ